MTPHASLNGEAQTMNMPALKRKNKKLVLQAPTSTANTSQTDFAIGNVLKKRVSNALGTLLQPQQQLVKCWCACQGPHITSASEAWSPTFMSLLRLRVGGAGHCEQQWLDKGC